MLENIFRTVKYAMHVRALTPSATLLTRGLAETRSVLVLWLTTDFRIFRLFRFVSLRSSGMLCTV